MLVVFVRLITVEGTCSRSCTPTVTTPESHAVFVHSYTTHNLQFFILQLHTSLISFLFHGSSSHPTSRYHPFNFFIMLLIIPHKLNYNPPISLYSVNSFLYFNANCSLVVTVKANCSKPKLNPKVNQSAKTGTVEPQIHCRYSYFFKYIHQFSSSRTFFFFFSLSGLVSDKTGFLAPLGAQTFQQNPCQTTSLLPKQNLLLLFHIDNPNPNLLEQLNFLLIPAPRQKPLMKNPQKMLIPKWIRKMIHSHKDWLKNQYPRIPKRRIHMQSPKLRWHRLMLEQPSRLKCQPRHSTLQCIVASVVLIGLRRRLIGLAKSKWQSLWASILSPLISLGLRWNLRLRFAFFHLSYWFHIIFLCI